MQDGDSLFAFLYACMRILSGHFETAMVVALANVFQGYWNCSDATAQAIKQGWLCTGDLARQDQDGDILLWIAKKISL